MTDNLELTPEDAALLLRLMDQCSMFRHEEPAVKLIARLNAHAALVPPPLDGDKVWYGITTRLVKNGTQHNQCRTIVRAKTKAEALRLLEQAGDNPGASRFNHYWSETGNRQSLALATERGVWAEGSKGWVKVWPKE